MRVSNTMLTGSYLKNLNQNLTKMMGQQAQIATGKRIVKLSDDPIGAINIMNSNVSIERLEQYERTVNSAQAWVDQTESSVLEINDVVKSAYETVVSSANSYLTAEDKQAAATLIGELRDHVLSVANSKSSDKYIFGGYNTNSEPFTVDGAGNILYNGIDMSNAADPALIAEGSQVIQYEVAYNMKMDISVAGTELLGTGDDNLYNILDDLYNALASDAPATDISQYAEKLQDAQGRLLNTESKIGGKTNRLDLVMKRHEEDIYNYTTLRSELEDVDQAEALMKYKVTESIYIASLQISSEIIQPTLVEFLK